MQVQFLENLCLTALKIIWKNYFSKFLKGVGDGEQKLKSYN